MSTLIKSIFGIAVILLLVVSFSGIAVVDEGHRGIKKTFGVVKETALTPGLDLHNPFTTDVVEMSIQSQVFEDRILVQTKDNQQVTVSYRLTYALMADSVVDMYTTVGLDWETKFLPQAGDGSVKEVIGNQTASSIVTQQSAARLAIEERLRQTLQDRGIRVERFEFGKIDYDANWLQAVAEKQRAEEAAKTAENNTVRIAEEARQRVIQAEAEAESIRIQGDALSQNPELVGLKWVEKWDGVLPTTVLGEAVPMIQLDDQR